MNEHDQELIAMLLGDAPPTPGLERWLETKKGRREIAVYRRALSALEQLYGNVATSGSGRVAYYDAVTTPIGRLLVAVTDGGLVRIALREREASFVTTLRKRLGAEVVRSRIKTAAIVSQLRAYFAGGRREFDVRIDLGALTPFQRRVLLATTKVPSGQVVSYADIARRIRRPRGSRAVGQALGRNPIPIVIPCHRVVGSGGHLGGYTGGLDVKKKLLRLEGALAAVG